jgi:predicted dehydrogenase
MIRVGVIGLGFGKQVHIPALRLDSRCKIEAVCSSNEARVKAAASELGIPKAYSRWQDLIADSNIDAITIATPPLLQGQILIEAIKAGKHVFCEKPLGLNSVRAYHLADEAERAGLANMIDFEFPDLTTWKAAWAQIKTLGQIELAQVNWQVQASGYREKPPGWKVQPALGGGTLRYLACHCLYYLEWLLGRIQSVRADIENGGELVAAHFAMESGAFVDLCVGGNRPLANIHRVEIFGKKTNLCLENLTSDYMKGFVLRSPATGGVLAREPETDQDGRIMAIYGVMKKFLDWIETGQTESPSFRNGARVEALMEAIERSAAEKNVVECF